MLLSGPSAGVQGIETVVKSVARSILDITSKTTVRNISHTTLKGTQLPVELGIARMAFGVAGLSGVGRGFRQRALATEP